MIEIISISFWIHQWWCPFFLSEPVAFRRVYGLESYSRTSGDSIHHRQSVSDTRVTPYQLSHEGASSMVMSTTCFNLIHFVSIRKLFCRWFGFLLGQAGCISVAAWTQLKVAFIISFRLVAWLFAAERRRISLLQPSCCCGVCGFSRRWLAFIWMIVLNTLLPLIGPPCPSRLLPKFAAQKEDESWSFHSIPLLINSINLKRDGVRICLGKDVGRWSIEGSLTPPSFRYRVNYIG